MDQLYKTTLKSLSKKLGFSETTISRVLNGKAATYRISKKTEQIILKTAKELNFSPNPLARGLRLKKTQTLGLVIPDISNPFFASIARSVEREARKCNYAVILCDTEENTDLEIKSVKLLNSRKVDGLVVAPVGQTSYHLEELYQTGLPIIIIDRYFNDKNLPFVSSDNCQGAFDAVTYLIENGHKIIACIQGLNKTTPNDERVVGYKDALQSYKIPVDESLIVGDSFFEQNGYVETKILLRRENRPTAIFAISNLISLGALRAIKEEKLHVPEDISIVSFDDQPYSEYLATPISTVVQQKNEIGQIATKIILNQIHSKVRLEPEVVLLPTKLIKRDSVKQIKHDVNHEEIMY